LDLRTGEVAWANAGHDEPFRLIISESRAEQWTSDNGPPLCVVDEFPYRAASARLAAGDTLVMFTDGITEAQDDAGRFYGMERLVECLSRLTNAASAQAVIEGLLADVHAFVGNAEQADDMTVLAIRWQGNEKSKQ
jgi:serine phosphatase RsbU (regulator of sigma subunit)